MKKTLSLALAFLQIFSFFTGVITTKAETLSNGYYIYDEFNMGDALSNYAHNNQDCSSCYYMISTIDGEEDNTALLYHDNWTQRYSTEKFDYLSLNVNGDTGITYEENKDIIIETRIMHTSSSGNFAFKINNDGNTENEAAHFKHALFIFKNNGFHWGDSPWVADATNTFTNAPYNNRWFTVKITIKGTSNKMDILITEDGTSGKAEYTDLVLPENVSNNALKNIAIRSVDGDDNIYIDYIKIKKQSPANFIIPTSALSEQTTLKIQFKNSNLTQEFAECFELYDSSGTNKLATTTLLDKLTNIATITYLPGFTGETTYIIKPDKQRMSALGFATDNVEEEYTINISKYVLDDRFNGSDISNWALYENNNGKLGFINSGDSRGGLFFTNTESQLNNQLAIKTLDKPVAHKAGHYTVIETKIKNTTGNTLTCFKMNVNPDLENNKEQVNNLFTLFGINKNESNMADNSDEFGFVYPTGVASDGKVNLKSAVKVSQGWVNNTYFIVKARIDGDNPDYAEITVTNELTGESQILSANLSNSENSIKNIAIRMGAGGTDTAVLDYLKISYEAKDTSVSESYNIKITDTDGSKVNYLTRGKTYYGEYTVTKGDTTDVESVTFIYGLYKDGELTNLHSETRSVKDHNDRLNIGFTIPEESTETYEIKVFLWEDITSSLTPVCNAVTAETQSEEDKYRYYYVSATGNDRNSGKSEDSPVANISRAIEIARLDGNPSSKPYAKIIVDSGTYYIGITNAIYISHHSSPSEKLVIQAKDMNNKPVLRNGEPFRIGDGTDTTKAIKVTDANILNRLNHLPNAETVKANLYEYDLTNIFGSVDKIPQMGLPGFYSYMEDKTFTTTDGQKLYVDETRVKPIELMLDGKPLTLARYPNEGAESEYIKISASDVVEKGAAPYFWQEGTDIGLYVEPENRYNIPMTISNDRAQYWNNAENAFLFGYFYYDWASQATPVTKIEGKNITTKYPSIFGLYAGRGSNDPRGYYIYNLLEEIDLPGEYCIDRTTGKLYFYKPTEATVNSEFMITKKDESTILIYASADNIIIDGLKLEGSRTNAIKVGPIGSGSGANNVTIKNCEISSTAEYAIMLSDSGHKVENCVIHDVNGGIYTNEISNANLTPTNIVIKNNKISNFSRLDKVYVCGITSKGVGNTITNNELFDSQHMAITFSGVDNVIAYNDIHHVLKEADDSGAIYVGRSWINQDNLIHNNYIHDLSTNSTFREGITGIYLDDYYMGADIQNNIFYNIDGRGVWDNRGSRNKIINNLFIDCYFETIKSGKTAIANGVYSPARTRNLSYFSGHYNYVENRIGTLFGNRYVNELYTVTDGVWAVKSDLHLRKGLVLEGNLFVNSGTESQNVINHEGDVINTNNYYDTTSVSSTYFDGQVLNIENIRSKVPGFSDVNFAKMGIQN